MERSLRDQVLDKIRARKGLTAPQIASGLEVDVDRVVEELKTLFESFEVTTVEFDIPRDDSWWYEQKWETL